MNTLDTRDIEALLALFEASSLSHLELSGPDFSLKMKRPAGPEASVVKRAATTERPPPMPRRT